MAAAAELQRRHEVGDVANREYLAGCGVEDGGGIGPAVGAGDHHPPGTLSLGEIGPALAFMFPARLPKAALAGEGGIGKMGHARSPKLHSRSEERRVGTECGSMCRTRWSA